MIHLATIHVLCRAVGALEEILGYVADGSEDMKRLVGDDAAMPIGAYMSPVRAAIDDDQLAYPMGEPRFGAPIPPFPLDAYHATTAKADAEIAKLPQYLKDRLKWTEPEADKIARRSAEAKAKRAEDEKRRLDPKRGGK